MSATKLCFSAVSCAAALLAAAFPSALAATITANSGGAGMTVNATVLGLNLNPGTLPLGAVGIAPGPYSISDSVLNVNVTSSIPVVVSGTVGAGVVTGAATSNVNGLAGPRTTSGTGSVTNANIDFVTLPFLGPGINMLGLDGTLSSTSQITGDFGSLTATGTTTIQSLALTIAGINVDLSAYVGASIAPNTGVNLSVLGISNAVLILNEQVISPDQSLIITNALHLLIELPTISASVYLGQSYANVSVMADAVPEPASAAMAAVVVAMLVSLRLRRVR